MKKKKTKKKKTDKPVHREGDFSQRDDGQSAYRMFISVAKTINMGNYESLRIEFGMGCTYQEDKGATEAREALLEEVVEHLTEIISTVTDS